MEKDPKEKSSTPSWWQTAPGILTAIAALITATGGFLIVLNQIGCFDKNVHKDVSEIKTPTENKETVQNNTENKIPDKQNSENNSSNNTTAANGTVKLSLPDDINMGTIRIKFLELSKDKYSTGNSSLKIKFRMLNEGTSYGTFDHFLFRLLFDGQMLSPEKPAQGYVDPKSSKDGETLFVFPESVDNADLQISYIYDEKLTAKFPIKLNTK